MAASKSANNSGSAKATLDHEEIRRWVEAHGGHPAMVKDTARDGTGGILRIDFPGYSGQRRLKGVSWAAFFEKFEESELAFLYQERTKSGRPSRFNKLVARETLAASPGPARRGRQGEARANGNGNSRGKSDAAAGRIAVRSAGPTKKKSGTPKSLGRQGSAGVR